MIRETKHAVVGTVRWKTGARDDYGTPRLVLLDDWEERNVGSVVIPLLRGKIGAPSDGRVRFYKGAIHQLLGAKAVPGRVRHQRGLERPWPRTGGARRKRQRARTRADF